MMQSGRTLLATLAALVIMTPCVSTADVPEMIGFQGVLTDLNDAEISAPGGLKMTFRFYHEAVGGADFWTDTFDNVAVDGGSFFALLGGGDNPLPMLELDGSIKYVGLSVADGPELEPRMQLVSVPYAMRAGSAATATYAEDAGSLGGVQASEFITKGEAGDISALTQKINQLETTVEVLLAQGTAGCVNECSVGQSGCSDDLGQTFTCEKADDSPCYEKVFSSCPGDLKCQAGQCACAEAYEVACIGDSVYEQDSCGNAGKLVESCGEGHCMGGACVSWKRITPLPLSTMKSMVTIGGHLYAVGTSGQVVHFDGMEWTHMATSTDKNLNDIWGYDTGAGVVLYAVGDKGKILRYEAGQWTTEITEVFSDLNAIFGRYDGNSLDLYVVGANGTMLHSSGADWTAQVWDEEDTWKSSTFTAVWMPATGTKMWIGGNNGLLIHYDTEDWVAQTSPEGVGHIADLWGASDSTVWAVTNGFIIRFKNNEWIDEDYGTTGVQFQALWGSKDNAELLIYAVGNGGQVYESDGFFWTKQTKVEDQLSGNNVMGVHGGDSPSAGTWIVTSDGKYAYLNADKKWIFPSIDRTIRSFWGMDGVAENLWGVGSDCLAIRYNGTEWLEVAIDGGTCADGSGSNDFTSMWGDMSGTFIYAVGDNLFKNWDGSAWVDATAPPSGQTSNDIWGTMKTDGDGNPMPVLYVVRNDATWFWNGSTWQNTAGGAGASGWGTATDNFYVVGDGSGNVKHFDGSEWNTTTVSVHALNDIYGTGAGDIWAVGVSGAVHHYDGKWNNVSIDDEVNSDLTSVWTHTLGAVYVAAKGGYAYSYNNGWYAEQTFPASDHHVVYGTSASNVLLGGVGTIYKK